ncbi:MAG: PilZ domain-containing protein [Hyphomicrobiaceae bacterium]
MFERFSLLNETGQASKTISSDAPFERVVVDDAAILEALVSESHHWATAATIITSCINYMSSDKAADLSPMMQAFIPHEAAILEPFRNGLLEIELNSSLVDSLLDTYSLISAGGDLIAAYAKESEEMGYQRAHVIHRETLVHHWYMICSELCEILDDVMPLVAHRIPEIYTDNWVQLRPLVISTTTGATPCIVDHKLVYPDIPQRRRSTRVGLLQRCEVHCDGVSFNAFAKDISETGIGIERCRALELGKTINVKLAGGRHLFGHVVWSHSNKAGISLALPLHPSDPLLFG